MTWLVTRPHWFMTPTWLDFQLDLTDLWLQLDLRHNCQKWVWLMSQPPWLMTWLVTQRLWLVNNSDYFHPHPSPENFHFIPTHPCKELFPSLLVQQSTDRIWTQPGMGTRRWSLRRDRDLHLMRPRRMPHQPRRDETFKFWGETFVGHETWLSLKIGLDVIMIAVVNLFSRPLIINFCQ